MDIKVKIDGLNELKSALSKWPNIAGRNIQEAIEKGIYEIEREAKPLTPVANPAKWKRPVKGYVGGTLRRSYKTIFGLFKGTIENFAPYATYVHEGTRYMRSRPFLKQGIDAAKDNINKHFKEALEKTIQEIANKVK